MANKGYIAFVVEGDEREPKIIENLKDIFFKESKFEVITLSAGQNIYMLWNQMMEDDFETDLIEVLRESGEELKKKLEGLSRDDFSELYLFFDYDGQQNNLPDGLDIESVILQMLQSFDNETENGKLYISYPMVEALRDYTPGTCGDKENCFWNKKTDPEEAGYKKVSAERSFMSGFGNFVFEDWKDVLNIFAMRVSCLMGREKEILSFQDYREQISPEIIFAAQTTHIHEEVVFILSAFPEFLLDYFPEKYWKSWLVHTELQKAVLCNGKRGRF